MDLHWVNQDEVLHKSFWNQVVGDRTWQHRREHVKKYIIGKKLWLSVLRNATYPSETYVVCSTTIPHIYKRLKRLWANARDYDHFCRRVRLEFPDMPRQYGY